MGRGAKVQAIDGERVVESTGQKVRRKSYIPQLPGGDLPDFRPRKFLVLRHFYMARFFLDRRVCNAVLFFADIADGRARKESALRTSRIRAFSYRSKSSWIFICKVLSWPRCSRNCR